MAVEPSLDSVRLRSTLLRVAVAAQAAMPSRALAALTALLPASRRCFVVWLCEKTFVAGTTSRRDPAFIFPQKDTRGLDMHYRTNNVLYKISLK